MVSWFRTISEIFGWLPCVRVVFRVGQLVPEDFGTFRKVSMLSRCFPSWSAGSGRFREQIGRFPRFHVIVKLACGFSRHIVLALGDHREKRWTRRPGNRRPSVAKVLDKASVAICFQKLCTGWDEWRLSTERRPVSHTRFYQLEVIQVVVLADVLGVLYDPLLWRTFWAEQAYPWL